MATPLPSEVETFLRRALPHFMAGKSVEDSLRAVLDDDVRLLSAAFKRSKSWFQPTFDERGISYATPPQVGDAIASEITSKVYAGFRAEQVPA